MRLVLRYLAFAVAFGLFFIGNGIVVGQLTPIPKSMVREVPNNLECEFYNATVTPRSQPNITWGCSGGGLFVNPLPTLSGIAAVVSAFFIVTLAAAEAFPPSAVFRLVWPLLYIEIASIFAMVCRVLFVFHGQANLTYAAWTLPLLLVAVICHLLLKHLEVSKAERARRRRVEISAALDADERLKRLIDDKRRGEDA